MKGKTMNTYLIGGYAYRAAFWCNGDCLTEQLIAEGRLSPAARDLRVEENLTALSDALTTEERGDTDTFPHPVFFASGDLVGEVCDRCHGLIDE